MQMQELFTQNFLRGSKASLYALSSESFTEFRDATEWMLVWASYVHFTYPEMELVFQYKK